MTQTQAPGTGSTQDEPLEALGNYRFGWHDSDVLTGWLAEETVSAPQDAQIG